MKPAENINELANNLYGDIIITQKDKNVYVPIYDRLINDLRDEIINVQKENMTFYIAGQAGTGKTSAMNFLPNVAVELKHDIVYLNGRDLFDPNDVDIVDILLMFSYKLIESQKKLQKKFYDLLDKIDKKHQGILDEEIVNENSRKGSIGANSGVSVGATFLKLIGLKADFFASYVLDKEYRRVTRTYFQFKKRDLLNLANEIIHNYYQESKTGKKLLVIFDDLDKMRISDQINAVFIVNQNYLTGLECKKIIAVPVHLTTEAEFKPGDSAPTIYGLKLENNPLAAQTIEGDIIKKNKELLKQIILKRIDPASDLIEDDAIEEAINYSGGMLRQYIRILHNAAKRVRRSGLNDAKISLADIKEAVAEERRFMSGQILGKQKIELLREIQTQHTSTHIENKELLIEAILGLQVIIYRNNDSWYNVNPIISETVRIYSNTR